MPAYSKAVKEQSTAVPANSIVDGTAREARAGGLLNGMPPAPNLEVSILDKLKGKPGGVSLTEVAANGHHLRVIPAVS